MKVLLTGAFGNVGQSALAELLGRGHEVRCFDLKTAANSRAAAGYKQQAEVHWGDLRHLEDVTAAVRETDAVVHLAFIIPTLSATGAGSEEDPEWARVINVGGTRNLIQVIAEQARPPKLIFASSLHVYGRTHDQPPPRTLLDPVQPIEHYAKHKVACEALVRASGLEWAIFRLGAALPVRLVLDPGMFEVPLDNRIEFVHASDVAVAIANGLEDERIWGRTWLIGGGPKCQYYQREIVENVLAAVGVGMLPEEAFTSTPFPTDWLDTTESQAVLRFQRRTLDNYVEDLKRKLGYRRRLIVAFRPFIRRWLLSKSAVLARHG